MIVPLISKFVPLLVIVNSEFDVSTVPLTFNMPPLFVIVVLALSLSESSTLTFELLFVIFPLISKLPLLLVIVNFDLALLSEEVTVPSTTNPPSPLLTNSASLRYLKMPSSPTVNAPASFLTSASFVLTLPLIVSPSAPVFNIVSFSPLFMVPFSVTFKPPSA